MKRWIMSFCLVVLCSISQAQVTVVQNGDSVYQKKVFGRLDSLSSRWELREDLPKGVYWVVEETPCKVDTLERGEFIEDGVKHGVWISWEHNLCGGLIDETTGEVEEWVPSDNSIIYDQIIYDSGNLVSWFWSFYDSSKARVRFFYPKGASEFHQWNREELWSEDGLMLATIDVDLRGITLRRSFHPNGRLRQWEKFDHRDKSVEPSRYYYENGKLKAQGSFESSKGGSQSIAVLSQIGKWTFWDKEGRLLANAWFRKEEIKRFKIYQNVDLTIHEINRSIFSR